MCYLYSIVSLIGNYLELVYLALDLTAYSYGYGVGIVRIRCVCA